jgi:cytochrome P450
MIIKYVHEMMHQKYCYFKYKERKVLEVFSNRMFHLSDKARDRMYAMLDCIISRRRNEEGFQKDFLESLITKHSKGADDEDKLTDTQLKDNILTLLVAGHDTTTAALTWLIQFLGENPAVLEQLRVLFTLKIQSSKY